MNIKLLIGTALLGSAILASGASLAQASRVLTNAEIMRMDLNKDGRVTKDEFLSAMGKVFDDQAGAKGYCSADDMRAIMKAMQDYSYLDKYNN
jgi:hypothetical protein